MTKPNPKLYDKTQKVLIHHYNAIDGSYVYSSEYLVIKDTGLPACSTDKRPPNDIPDGQWPIFLPDQDVWRLAIDHRTMPQWNKLTQELSIVEHVGPLAPDQTLQPPKTPYDEWVQDVEHPNSGTWITNITRLKKSAYKFLDRRFQEAKARGLDIHDMDEELLQLLMFAQSKWVTSGSPDVVPAEFEAVRDDGMSDAVLLDHANKLINDCKHIMVTLKTLQREAQRKIKSADSVVEVYKLRDECVAAINKLYRLE